MVLTLLDFTEDKSTSVQVMACWQQAFTWANVDTDICRHMASMGHNELNKFYKLMTYAVAHFIIVDKTMPYTLAYFITQDNSMPYALAYFIISDKIKPYALACFIMLERSEFHLELVKIYIYIYICVCVCVC